MKICLVTSFPPSRDALNEYGFHIASELRQLPGIELTVLADEYAPLQVELDGFSVVRCWKFNSLSNPWRVLRAIWHERPDVVWFNLGFASFGGKALPAFLGIAIPFFARLVETAVREVDGGLVEAVQAMGGNTWTIVRKVLVPESLPSLIASATTTVVALIGYSAMAGTVGAGGLGDIAIRYGYQRFETELMWITVAILAVVISVIQFAGDYAARSLHRRGGHSGSAPRLRQACRKMAGSGLQVPTS